MAARTRSEAGGGTGPDGLAALISALDAASPEALPGVLCEAVRTALCATAVRVTPLGRLARDCAPGRAGAAGDEPPELELDVVAGGPPLARVEVVGPRRGACDPAAVRLVLAHVAQALENLRLRRLAADERRRGRRMADAVAALRRALDPGDVAERVVDAACAVTGAAAAALLYSGGARAEVLARHELPPLSAAELARLLPPESRHAMRAGISATGRPLAADDPLRARGYGAVALVAVGPEAVHGVLAVLADSPDGLGDAELDVLGDLAAHAAAAMTSAALRRQVDELGAIDPLTGLFNARYLEHRLEQEAARATRTGHVLSVAVLALDGAAERRAERGEAEADLEVRRFSAVVAARLRAMDVGCRLSADELVIVLPDATSLQAYGVGERLRAAVAADIGLRGRTASVGIASHPDRAATPPQLLAHARTALGYARRHGGDRCFLYDAEVARLLRHEDDAERASQEGLVETVTALAATVDGRHPTTREHSRAVARTAALVAEALGLPGDRVEDVRLAGLVHDVGKMGIDEEVLVSPAPLTPSQWEEMRQHPDLGQRMLAGSRLEPLRPWVLHHHERMDGTGYPDGLAGEAIPLEARIIAAAEALDAMTSGAPYRPSVTRAEALAELRRCAGTQFDPRVVEALVSLDAAGRLGAAA